MFVCVCQHVLTTRWPLHRLQATIYECIQSGWTSRSLALEQEPALVDSLKACAFVTAAHAQGETGMWCHSHSLKARAFVAAAQGETYEFSVKHLNSGS